MVELSYTTYITLFIGIVILCGLLVYVTISYFISMKSLRETNKRREELLSRAQNDYQEIISAAQKKADGIIMQATKINQETESNLNQAVINISEKEEEAIRTKSEQVINNFENKLRELNDNNINLFKTTSDDFGKFVNNHFDEVKKILQDQTMESKKLAEEKIQGEYDALEKELAGYKEAQIKKIDENVYQILFNISKIAFGRGLNLENHEALVNEALEEAKKLSNSSPVAMAAAAEREGASNAN
ncbi:MAG TPA: hypothetical protein VG965_02990 [Patescibacteria group bacterium]|nr:hypothetical protein [Patescibacteria group bacterium]